MKKFMFSLFTFIMSVPLCIISFAADGSENNGNIGTVILIAVITALIIGGIFVGVVFLKYKMKLQPTNYPLDKFTHLDITDSSDVFVTSRTTRVRIKSNSDKK